MPVIIKNWSFAWRSYSLLFLLLLQRTLPSREKEYMAVASIASMATTWVHSTYLMWFLKTRGSEKFKSSGKGKKMQSWYPNWGPVAPSTEREREGGSGWLQCSSKVAWCPLRETALLLVKPGEGWLLDMLWRQIQLPVSPQPHPLLIFWCINRVIAQDNITFTS